MVNEANETIFGDTGIGGAIHETAGLELLDECWNLNDCKIGECKVTSGYKSANYVFNIVVPSSEAKR